MVELLSCVVNLSTVWRAGPQKYGQKCPWGPLRILFLKTHTWCLVTKLCLTLLQAVDCSPRGSSVHRIFQERILQWLPRPPPGDLPGPGIEPSSPALAGRFFPTDLPGSPKVALGIGQIPQMGSQFNLTSWEIDDYYVFCQILGNWVLIILFDGLPFVDFSGGLEGKASACNAGDPGSIPVSGRSLEKEMAPHSSTLAWKTPWMEEPGRLQSSVPQRVGHDFTFTFFYLFYSWASWLWSALMLQPVYMAYYTLLWCWKKMFLKKY